jgi:CYTH domain
MTEAHTSSGHFESEVAFIITNNAEDLAQDLAGLTSILEYDLKPGPTRRIHDVYYDTKRGLLQRRMISLRVRKTDGNLLVSMKSDPQRLDREGVRRIEIEAPWSPQSLARIQETLRGQQFPKSKFPRLLPADAFASMGLRIIQERTTRRMVREILRHDAPRAKPVAELDIDKVTFVEDPKVHVFEVEIEAKADRSERRIQQIAETLESNYPDFLRLWPYGKLATGLAIHRLLKSRILQTYLEHGRFRAEAFPLIEKDILSTNT